MAYEPMPRTIAPLDVVTHRAPQDGSFAYTSSSTITASGFPVDLSDTVAKVLWVGIKASAGTSWSWYVEGRGGISFYFSASNVLTCTGATPFASGDTYMVGLVIFDKTTTNGTDSQRVEEINPPTGLPENWVNATDLSADTRYYPGTTGFSTVGFPNGFSIQGQIAGGVTATIEATNDAGTDFLDVTESGYNYLTGTDSFASFVDTNFYLVYKNPLMNRVRVKIVTSDATNSVQLDLFRA